jgi:hypothetical protein
MFSLLKRHEKIVYPALFVWVVVVKLVFIEKCSDKLMSVINYGYPGCLWFLLYSSESSKMDAESQSRHTEGWFTHIGLCLCRAPTMSCYWHLNSKRAATFLKVHVLSVKIRTANSLQLPYYFWLLSILETTFLNTAEHPGTGLDGLHIACSLAHRSPYFNSDVQGSACVVALINHFQSGPLQHGCSTVPYVWIKHGGTV